MSTSIGPELPPHLLAKRKRKQEAEESIKKSKDTSLEHRITCDESSESPGKRQRIVGPALPPAPAGPSNEQLLNRVDDKEEAKSDSSSDDDGYGPSPPSAQNNSREPQDQADRELEWAKVRRKSPLDERPKRDDWMMLPPKQDDLAARMDPTKVRARGFNTGKGAQGPNQLTSDDNAMWTETPEQKRKRLENEVLGITDSSKSSRSKGAKDSRKQAEDEEKALRVREYNEKHRNRSLYEEHKKVTKKEKEDDPSERAFDYEKDMARGTKITHAQRRDMLNKAGQFGTRFSGGSFL